jgi:hypothetical protein
MGEMIDMKRKTLIENIDIPLTLFAHTPATDENPKIIIGLTRKGLIKIIELMDKDDILMINLIKEKNQPEETLIELVSP